MQAECFETMPAEAVNRMGNASQQERNAVEADGKHDGADPLQRLVQASRRARPRRGDGLACFSSGSVAKERANNGHFVLKADNGEVIATSQHYKSKDSCKKGIESVKKNAPTAEIVEEEA